MNSVLITNSGIDRHSGGGVMSYNLYLALKKYTNLLAVLGMSNKEKLDVPFESINPYDYKQQFSPFLMDYFSLKNLMQFKKMNNKKIDLAMFYSDPFPLTAYWLRQTYPNIKIIADLAPHNIEVSKEEHERIIGNYPYPHLTDENLWMLYSEHLRLADIVIVHSHASAEYIKKKAKLNKMPIVIPHGCYLPEKIEYPDELTFGALNVAGIDKGLIYSLQAWKKVVEETRTNAKFLIAGLGTEQWIPVIERMKVPNVEVLGWINNIEDFYNKINVGIYTSITEGFGLPILETMAYGKPVIVSEGAGASELVDNKNGFIVPIRHLNATAKAIRFFIDNPDVVKLMGENARKKAEKYTWNKIIEEYGKVIKRLENE